MLKKIITSFIALCIVLASLTLPVTAYSGKGINLTFSSSDVNPTTGIPTGVSPLSVPTQGTVGSPYTHGVASGLYGKEKSDDSFWFTGKWNSDTFIEAGGITPTNIQGAGYTIPASIKDAEGQIIQISFEILHDDYTDVGYVECRPNNAEYTGAGSPPYFNKGQMLNMASNGMRIFGTVVQPHAMLAGAWNKFDYIFFTKYTTDNSNYYTAVDVYMNGKKLINKLALDADSKVSGTQLMSGLFQLRFAFSMKKVNDEYPKNTTVIDNVFANVVSSEPVITQPILSHASLTVDNDFRSISNTSDTMTASDVITGLPNTYNYELVDASGRVLIDNTLTSDGFLRVRDKDTNAIIAIYKFNQPDFPEADYSLKVPFSKTDINTATGTPTGVTPGNVPKLGSENSPYTYGMASGKFGKQSTDDHFWFTSEWASSAFVESDGISAASLVNGAFNLSPKVKNVNDGIIHMSFEMAREGFERGTSIQCRPLHDQYTGGSSPYFKQGNLLDNNKSNGLYIFGQKIDTEHLPMDNWNKFDYVFFTKYTTDNINYQSAVDVYFNGYKVIDKLLLDADSVIEGNQLMTGLVNIRFTIAAVKDGNAYPKATAYIDNVECGERKRVPIISPIEISHAELAIDNKYRIIKDSELGISVGDLLDGLDSAYAYAVVSKAGAEKVSSDNAAPGYLRISSKDTGEVLATYKFEQQLSCELSTTNLTMLRDSINGFANMTVAQVKADAKINAQSTATVYYADGTPANDSDIALSGMYIRVTAADGETYKDYKLEYPDHRVGEISYRVWNLDTTGTFSADGKLTVDATIDSYTDKISRGYVLFVGKYKDDRLLSIYKDVALINSITSKTLSLEIPLSNEEGVSYKMFLWGGLNSPIPLKKAYVSDTHLGGKTIACFGDSITGMGILSYPETLQWNTGANTLNLGIGSARMTTSSQPISAFSMATIVDGLTTSGYEWTEQDAYANSSSGSDAVRDHLSNMKSTDLTKVDIATVFYGTNDFASSAPLDNATNNSTDPSTFGGAIRYSINKLLAANPNLKIVLITPMYRDRQGKTSDNPYIADNKNSDQFPNSKGDFLYEDYGKKIMQIADEYGDNVIAYDFYTDSGINYYNHSTYLYDGLHPKTNPDSDGNLLLGSKFADFLIRHF